MTTTRSARGLALALVLAAGAYAPPAYAQGPRNTATPQKLDQDYGARIKKATPDPRILTECRRRCRRRSSSSDTCRASRAT